LLTFGSCAAAGVTGRVPRRTTGALLDGSVCELVSARGIATVVVSPSAAWAIVVRKSMAMLRRLSNARR
jgi:hypothetical protein